MTQALSRANWIGPPSLCQLLLETLLRVAAMLWSNLAATFRTCLAVADLSRRSRKAKAERRRRMILSRPARECHTTQTPQALPGKTRDPIKETDLAVENSESKEALILRAHEVRVSKDESAPTAASNMTAPRGVSSRKCAALSGTHQSTSANAGPWVPALRRFAPPAGMTAVGVVSIVSIVVVVVGGGEVPPSPRVFATS